MTRQAARDLRRAPRDLLEELVDLRQHRMRGGQCEGSARLDAKVTFHEPGTVQVVCRTTHELVRLLRHRPCNSRHRSIVGRARPMDADKKSGSDPVAGLVFIGSGSTADG